VAEPALPESRKLIRTRTTVPLVTPARNIFKVNYPEFKMEREKSRQIELKRTKRKQALKRSQQLNAVIIPEAKIKPNNEFHDITDSFKKSPIEPLKDPEIQGSRRVPIHTYRTAPRSTPQSAKQPPYRTAPRKTPQSAKQPPYRTATAATHNSGFCQSTQNHPPEQSGQPPPTLPYKMNPLKILLGTLSILVTGYVLLSLGIQIRQLIDNIPVTPTPLPTVNNFTTSYERMKRSSPITSIGFDSAKVRDPTRWSLSTEDIGNIARLQPPEGTTTVTLQFVGSITVFEQSQSLGASEAQMVNAMKYLVKNIGEEGKCNERPVEADR
jgi:hypothetical protein